MTKGACGEKCFIFGNVHERVRTSQVCVRCLGIQLSNLAFMRDDLDLEQEIVSIYKVLSTGL